MNEWIRVENISKSYGGLHILKALSFAVKKGEILVIMGPSGIGKSTLLRILGKLEPQDEGEIYYDESLTRGIKIPFPFVFQEFDKLFPWLTVEKNILLSAERSEADLTGLLSETDLLSVRKKYPAQLSGGMKQRVQIARAMMTKANIMLMDEPFGSLDEEMRKNLQDLILRVNQKNGTTILFVTHDMKEAQRIGHRILMMKKEGISIQ